MREGFSTAKVLPRQAGIGYDWSIGAVVIMTKLSYVVVWCMDYGACGHDMNFVSEVYHASQMDMVTSFLTKLSYLVVWCMDYGESREQSEAE